MVLTPADVHNVAFSRPRLGKRGYDEQEVDLFVDLVEQELIRHLQEEGELRSRCAQLRNRFGGLAKLEAELAEREAAVGQQECQLSAQQSQLSARAALVARQGAPLPRQLAQLRHRETQAGRREAELARHEAELRDREGELNQWENELRQHEADLRRRLDEQQAIAAGQAQRQYRHAQQLRAVPDAAAVNGSPHLEQMRTVAAVHGRHDMERMAIRAVTDPLGNTVTETVHERTRRSPIDDGAPDAPAQRYPGLEPELERLGQENAELTRSLRLLKSAAALLAAALDRP
jgi:DivIVA domain-containing protein